MGQSTKNGEARWKASRNSQAVANVSRDLKTLIIKGLCIGHVRKVFDTGRAYILSPEIESTSRQRKEHLQMSARHTLDILEAIKSVYESPEASREALWRSLVASANNPSEGPPLGWESEFMTWLNEK